jgi:acetyl-CoA C-acetyltransferase
VAHCADLYNLGYRDLARSRALKKAAAKVYQMAGISDPLRDIDVAELYDAYSYMELMWMEGLGLAPEGKAAEMVRSGATAMGGKLPVNPSGGVLSSHPVLVAGMARLIEATLQVRGEAGERQIKGAKTALAQGINGPCGQAHCIFIVGS